ncbi:DUF4358 domain-containing protein [Turicibacter sanguinis]|nr:DUF4358 domain-containing protein [Turicibacter sanguinis]MTN51427.1 DUF4358 domain-containing protein [Turicibacter sanguinis]MTN54584.1 DUF4358 domain-containing protein [Turicibacter sanguinis]MTN57717.1 DUF4358 domain-containing protein [Turicibacter sanguinis]MTN60773.1 DUF4358 domain-containing protein [Turicibacter sanguinis]
MMKKLSILVLGSFILISMLTGCEKATNVSLEQINEALLVDETRVKEVGSKELRRFIGVNPNEILGYVYYVSISSMEVEEILVVEVKDRSQLEDIESMVEARVESQINRFSGYKPENCSLLDNYELKVRGSYLFFAVSNEVDTYCDAFLNAFRK